MFWNSLGLNPYNRKPYHRQPDKKQQTSWRSQQAGGASTRGPAGGPKARTGIKQRLGVRRAGPGGWTWGGWGARDMGQVAPEEAGAQVAPAGAHEDAGAQVAPAGAHEDAGAPDDSQGARALVAPGAASDDSILIDQFAHNMSKFAVMYAKIRLNKVNSH
jgi:hypothetical protein